MDMLTQIACRGAADLSLLSFQAVYALSIMPAHGCLAVCRLVAEDEELFDNREHGILAYARYDGGLKNLVIIPDIQHYGIYREAWEETHQLALDWFDKHLK
jgi:hypothetical protein